MLASKGSILASKGSMLSSKGNVLSCMILLAIEIDARVQSVDALEQDHMLSCKLDARGQNSSSIH